MHRPGMHTLAEVHDSNNSLDGLQTEVTNDEAK